MARSLYVDTSAWYGLIDRRDVDHERLADVVQRHVGDGGRLVSTDYVLDESLTLARARSGSRAAFGLMDLVQQTSALDLEWIGSQRFDRACRLFRQYEDQAFSFTDCTSFAVMRELRLTEALTKDDHFRIAGFSVVPRE